MKLKCVPFDVYVLFILCAHIAAHLKLVFYFPLIPQNSKLAECCLRCVFAVWEHLKKFQFGFKNLKKSKQEEDLDIGAFLIQINASGFLQSALSSVAALWGTKPLSIHILLMECTKAPIILHLQLDWMAGGINRIPFVAFHWICVIVWQHLNVTSGEFVQ